MVIKYAMKRLKLKVVYKSNWNTITNEQKKEYSKKICEVYDVLFQQIFEENEKESVVKINE